MAIAATTRSPRVLATWNGLNYGESGGGLSLHWRCGCKEEEAGQKVAVSNPSGRFFTAKSLLNITYSFIVVYTIVAHVRGVFHNCTHSYVRDVTWNPINKRSTRVVVNFWEKNKGFLTSRFSGRSAVAWPRWPARPQRRWRCRDLPRTSAGAEDWRQRGSDSIRSRRTRRRTPVRVPTSCWDRQDSCEPEQQKLGRVFSYLIVY